MRIRIFIGEIRQSRDSAIEDDTVHTSIHSPKNDLFGNIEQRKTTLTAIDNQTHKMKSITFS